MFVSIVILLLAMKIDPGLLFTVIIQYVGQGRYLLLRKTNECIKKKNVEEKVKIFPRLGILYANFVKLAIFYQQTIWDKNDETCEQKSTILKQNF